MYTLLIDNGLPLRNYLFIGPLYLALHRNISFCHTPVRNPLKVAHITEHVFGSHDWDAGLSFQRIEISTIIRSLIDVKSPQMFCQRLIRLLQLRKFPRSLHWIWTICFELPVLYQFDNTKLVAVPVGQHCL